SEAVYHNFHQYLPDFIMDQMCIGATLYHPTFLYESVWNIFVFILLLLLRKYNPLLGYIFLSYIVMYSIVLIFIEGMRTDSLFLVPIKQAQFLSLLLIIGAIILIIYRRTSKKVDSKYDGSIVK